MQPAVLGYQHFSPSYLFHCHEIFLSFLARNYVLECVAKLLQQLSTARFCQHDIIAILTFIALIVRF